MQIIQLCDLYIKSDTEVLIIPRTRRHRGLGSFSPGRFTYRRYGVMEMKTVCSTVAVPRPLLTTLGTTRRMPRSSVCQVDFVLHCQKQTVDKLAEYSESWTTTTRPPLPEITVLIPGGFNPVRLSRFGIARYLRPSVCVVVCFVLFCLYFVCFLFCFLFFLFFFCNLYIILFAVT